MIAFIINIPPLPLAEKTHRQIILIGIDSLSNAVLQQSAQELPTLHGLASKAIYYDRAYTPLARTFPAWLSILSGKSPAEHGGIDNLRNLDKVNYTNTVAQTLRRDYEYRTIFAIDERRFSNIDERFGFDQVIGPKAGAPDFFLQPWNDMPLCNLFLQTNLAEYFLPYSHFNTASHVNYDAFGFVKKIVSSLDTKRSNFLAVHFESAHFPYKTRYMEAPTANTDSLENTQMRTFKLVDKQVALLITSLRNQKLLEDTLLILLSDHGESLDEQTATEPHVFGHGSNLLAEHQNNSVLGLLQFHHGQVVSQPNKITYPVTLSDLRPAIEFYAHDGIPIRLQNRDCLISETGIRLDSIADYRNLDPKAVTKEGSKLYSITPEGLLAIQEKLLTYLVMRKDIAYRCQDRLTLYSAKDQRYRYYAFEKNTWHEILSYSNDIFAKNEIKKYYEQLIKTAKQAEYKKD